MDWLNSIRMRGVAAGLVVALLAVWGCSTNPATGKQ